MPALNLALGLRVIGGAADVFHFLLIPAIARDPSRRTTRRYPTANAVGDQALSLSIASWTKLYGGSTVTRRSTTRACRMS
jgi:hypothetical protein